MSQPTKDEELKTLELTYRRLCDERDRLRAARGFFSRGLGPAPASAGISIALVAAFGDGANPAFLGPALAGVVAMVVVGIWYGSAPPYRVLYARKITGIRREINAKHPELVRSEQRDGPDRVEDRLPPATWYRTMIRLEREIYGGDQTRNHSLPPWKLPQTLQEGLDSERTGTLCVQALWVVVVALLVLSVLF
jgi:hypothetical protein